MSKLVSFPKLSFLSEKMSVSFAFLISIVLFTISSSNFTHSGGSTQANLMPFDLHT